MIINICWFLLDFLFYITAKWIPLGFELLVFKKRANKMGFIKYKYYFQGLKKACLID